MLLPDTFSGYEEVTEFTAHEEVPNKEPVIPLVTFKDPVIC